MIQIFWYIVTVATTLLVLIILWQFRISIVLFLLSLALAAALRPLINNIAAGRKIPRRLALGIVYGLLIGMILLFNFVLIPPLSLDLQTLTDNFATAYESIKITWPHESSLFKQTLAEQLPPAAELMNALTSEEAAAARQGFLGAAQNFFSTLGYLGIVIILSLYWSADQLRFERLGLSMFPAEQHTRVLHIWRAIETGVGAYLRSEAVQSVLVTSFLLAGFVLMGANYPTLLALWVTLARLIPWFGVLIAIVPLLVMGISSASILGFLPAVYTLIVLFALKKYIEPRFIVRRRYNSLFIVLFVIGMGVVFGLIGVLLAPPLAVALQILFQQLQPETPPEASDETLHQKIVSLKQRFAKVQDRLQTPLPPESSVVMTRLDRLLEQVHDQVRGR